MPGIVGLITKMPRQEAEQQLRRMVAAIDHESFYHTGTWIDEARGVYVGWAIPQNSFADGMPLANEREDVVLVFSGEEYPEPGTAQRLKERGHTLGEKPSSCLVHLYEEDPAFPSGLNGRFQGLLTDRSRGTATLFNDRYGMHRVYYHEAKEAFYFAVEAKAILAVRSELGPLDPRGLGEFVACGCILENRTLFQGIHMLPCAAAWVFRNGVLQSRGSYFQPQAWEDQAPLDRKSYYDEIRRTFSNNLPRYFNGQEHVAMSLTGGLDTRMIMAWTKSLPGSLPCYSFGGRRRDSQDVLMARRVAQVCQQPHEVIPVGDEFLSHFSDYAERTVYLTEGCVEVKHAPDLYLNERAREIAPVRVTGNYGGEVLRRVRAFRPAEPTPGLFDKGMRPHFGAAKDTYEALTQCHPLSFAVFRQAPWHHYGLLGLEQTQLSVRSPYLDNDFVKTVFRAPESECVNDEVCLRLIADGNPTLRSIRTDRGLAGNRKPLASAVPRSLLTLTFKAEYAYDLGMPQWAARVDHAFSRLHLERLFLGRHKFTHFRVWYRDALAAYVREMLLDPRSLSRPYIERNGLKAIVQGHLKGDQNHTAAIHKVLTLELVHRLFVDSR